jgi:hypothetical protein
MTGPIVKLTIVFIVLFAALPMGAAMDECANPFCECPCLCWCATFSVLPDTADPKTPTVPDRQHLFAQPATPPPSGYLDSIDPPPKFV